MSFYIYQIMTLDWLSMFCKGEGQRAFEVMCFPVFYTTVSMYIEIIIYKVGKVFNKVMHKNNLW